MKFCKTYTEYLERQDQEMLPVVRFKKLKKVMKKCRSASSSSSSSSYDVLHESLGFKSCLHQCPVCDGTFFPSLLNEVSDILGFFNQRAQRLLQLHLASGFRKYILKLKGKLKGNNTVLIQEGIGLVQYALISGTAIRKILKKYDKIHYSKQGQLFKAQVQTMHKEILQSPWLRELMALYINLRETKVMSKKVAEESDDGCSRKLEESDDGCSRISEESDDGCSRISEKSDDRCSLTFPDGKPSLTCRFKSIQIDIDLTCSICMDTVFDPVSLTCGHIFCYSCACSAASVTIVDGLKAAGPKEKCPLCRERGVYVDAVHLEELNILLGRRCQEYWEERLQMERVERVKQAKEHWEAECSKFMGV